MQSDRLFPKILWLILAVALLLRLAGAWRANLIFDERAHLALAETVDFRPASLHLVSRTLDHPLLSIYVLKFGGILFGKSDLALRMLYVLAGTLTVVPVFFLGKRVFSEKAGLWAAGLLAVDQFHAGWSRVFMPEVLMLLFAALALLQFLRALQKPTTGNYVLLGVLLGLAYLAKEPAILLIPALWLYLLITPEHRHVLSRPAWYLAQGVFLLVIAPDIVWNLLSGRESYLYRDAVLITEAFQLSGKSVSLYLGEILQAVLGRHVMDIGYEEGNLHACHWPAGVLYLTAIVAALGKRKAPAVRLMLVVFWFVFICFLLMPGGERFDPFWWASLSLIPAVVCAGWVLDWVSGRGKALCMAAFILLAYLGIHYVPVAWHAGPHFARATVDDFVRDFLAKAHTAIEDRNDLREAQSRFVYVLNIGGPQADAYYGLALVAHRRNQTAKAKKLLAQCLAIDPDHEKAIELRRTIEQREPNTGKSLP